MKVRYQETGGFAGLTKSCEVDVAELAAEEAEAVQAAALAAPESLEAWTPEPALPDQEEAQLFLIHDDGRWQPLLTRPGAAKDALEALRARLAKDAKYERGGGTGG